MKRLYLDSGYVNMKYVLSLPTPFIFCVGGRGTGKTYGTLAEVLKTGKQFLYMRRTQTQSDLISKPDFSPLQPVCRDLCLDLKIEQASKYSSSIYIGDEDRPRGYTVALSTISNLRGFDMSECDYLIYDEFIPEMHERKLKNEGEALLNAYETINRNRELQGRQPLKCLCLSNANGKLGSPIFDVVGIADKVMSMYAKNQELSISNGLTIILLNDSPISGAKADTALYKVASDHYKQMALANKFDDHFIPKTVNIKEYRPLVQVHDIVIYKHKSEDKLYCSTFKTGSPEVISWDLYNSRYYDLVYQYDIRGAADYDKYTTRAVLLDE